MSANRYVMSFEEFIAEGLEVAKTVPLDYNDNDGELDDTNSPDLPKELKDKSKKHPLTRFLVDKDLEDDENEEGEP